jgi:uncharacterized protein (DUF362 family)/ferredoxin
MIRSKVAVVRCNGYDDNLVREAVKTGVGLLGGISLFVKPEEKIVLKPNVLIGSGPERSVTTHPVVFKEVGRMFQEAGAIVSHGDSPSLGGVEFNLKRAQLKAAGDEMGFTLADFDNGREIFHQTALLNKKFVIANGILEADGVVNLPKLKTHQLTRFTGAVKNLFGCIPGQFKREFHFKMPDPYNFATMLVDINSFIRPRLVVMDGIVAMEGNGPFAGSSRPMNILLFSTDPIAIDSIACKIIDLDPEFVPTSKPGEKAGLGTYHYENIELVGDSLDSFIARDFRVTRSPPVRTSGSRLQRFIRNQLTPRPLINPVKCVSCGNCIQACPTGTEALDWFTDSQGKKIPRIQHGRCIRCYCCQETCPEGAITVERPFVGRLIFRRKD